MMKIIVLAALIQFLCAKSITNATREAIEEKIKRLMANGEYRATTLGYSLQMSVDGSPDQVDRAGAEAICSHKGGRLLSLNTQRKVTIFQGQASNWLWIGAKRESYQENFKWLTGELIEPSNLHWNTGVPDGLTVESYAGSSNIPTIMNRYPPTANSGTACEYNVWQPDKANFNTSNYKTTFVVVPGSMSYDDAVSKCQRFDGFLAAPSSFRELDAIDALMDELSVETAWIGARRDVDKIHQPLTWSNGFKIVKNLRTIHPEDGGECLFYYKSQEYFDFHDCGVSLGGIVCQIDH